jgi:hypothetical protein
MDKDVEKALKDVEKALKRLEDYIEAGQDEIRPNKDKLEDNEREFKLIWAEFGKGSRTHRTCCQTRKAQKVAAALTTGSATPSAAPERCALSSGATYHCAVS